MKLSETVHHSLSRPLISLFTAVPNCHCKDGHRRMWALYVALRFFRLPGDPHVHYVHDSWTGIFLLHSGAGDHSDPGGLKEGQLRLSLLKKRGGIGFTSARDTSTSKHEQTMQQDFVLCSACYRGACYQPCDTIS